LFAADLKPFPLQTMKTQTRQTREGLTPSPFVAALRLAILKAVAEMRRDRCSGASLACLRQMTTPPSDLLDGAPRGTNAVYFYGEIFDAEAREIVPEFILETSFRGGAL
jgi:hypothetical protein